MTGDDWRGFDVAAYNARARRGRGNDSTPTNASVDATDKKAAPRGVSPVDGNPAVDVPRGAAPVVYVLPFPPTTNHDKAGGIYLTPETRAFRRAVADVVRARNAEPVTGRLAVSLTLYPSPARRAFDLDNRVKPMLDALQHAGAYPNDEAVDYLHVFRVLGCAADASAERCVATIVSLGPE
jgi:Holliday junction resolvase RusA-like endonuclease